MVPAVYDIARGSRAASVVDVVISIGAATAVYGIIQYGLLHYDNLGQRPQGTLSHYMTYSGCVMLILCAAASRVIFGTRERAWPALIMPALVVALVLTFTRNAWIGACVAVGLLLVLKDLRLTALLPGGGGRAFRDGARQLHQPPDVDVQRAGPGEPGSVRDD